MKACYFKLPLQEWAKRASSIYIFLRTSKRIPFDSFPHAARVWRLERTNKIHVFYLSVKVSNFFTALKSLSNHFGLLFWKNSRCNLVMPIFVFSWKRSCYCEFRAQTSVNWKIWKLYILWSFWIFHTHPYILYKNKFVH